jgi:hypothetical protein
MNLLLVLLAILLLIVIAGIALRPKGKTRQILVLENQLDQHLQRLDSISDILGAIGERWAQSSESPSRIPLDSPKEREEDRYARSLLEESSNLLELCKIVLPSLTHLYNDPLPAKAKARIEKANILIQVLNEQREVGLKALRYREAFRKVSEHL